MPWPEPRSNHETARDHHACRRCGGLAGGRSSAANGGPGDRISEQPIARCDDGCCVGIRRGLRESGFTEGQNVRIEYRWAEDRYDRLPALADELVRENVSVILAGGGNV